MFVNCTVQFITIKTTFSSFLQYFDHLPVVFLFAYLDSKQASDPFLQIRMESVSMEQSGSNIWCDLVLVLPHWPRSCTLTFLPTGTQPFNKELFRNHSAVTIMSADAVEFDEFTLYTRLQTDYVHCTHKIVYKDLQLEQ